MAYKGTPREVHIYCDGACKGNPGVGGYAAVVTSGTEVREIKGAVPHTTNNRMELTAAIRAFESLGDRCVVRVFTDSQYLLKGATEWASAWIRRGWKTAAKKPVLNRDLWQHLLKLIEGHEVSWEWVPGHDGVTLNERCDRLANEAIDEFLAHQG